MNGQGRFSLNSYMKYFSSAIIVNAIAVLLIISGCINNRPDSMYEGPVVNAECALEVAPPRVADEVKKQADTIKKDDPLIRQGGVNVCRSF